MGDSAWKNFIFEKESIYLYWSEEFTALIKWLDSKFDEFGTTESDIHVVLRHEDKEIWCYMGGMFPGGEKRLKQIRKSRTVEEYESALEALMDENSPEPDRLDDYPMG